MGDRKDVSLGTAGHQLGASVSEEEKERVLSLLRSNWFSPHWLLAAALSNEPAGDPPSPPPPKLPSTPQPQQPLPLNPRATSPKQPKKPPKPVKLRKAKSSDLMRAVWKLPQIKLLQKGLELKAMRLWDSSKPIDKAAIVTQSILISGGVMAGILANDHARTWALAKISGVNIPVPGVKGLSFKLYTADGVVRGGGFGFKNRILDYQWQVEPVKLPNGSHINDQRLMIQLNLHELIRSLR